MSVILYEEMMIISYTSVVIVRKNGVLPLEHPRKIAIIIAQNVEQK